MVILEFIRYKQIIQQLAQKGGEKFVQVAEFYFWRIAQKFLIMLKIFVQFDGSASAAASRECDSHSHWQFLVRHFAQTFFNIGSQN